MRDLIPGENVVMVEGGNVREVIESLDARYPGAKSRLCREGNLRAGVSVAVDGSASSMGLRQIVGENSEVHFLPAIGGG